MKNKIKIKKIYFPVLLMIFLSFTTNTAAQTLDEIISQMCSQMKTGMKGNIIMQDSLVSGTDFTRANNEIVVFPAPRFAIDLNQYISNSDKSKWDDTSKEFATLALRLLPPTAIIKNDGLRPEMIRNFVKACSIIAGTGMVTPEIVKEALIKLSSGSSDPKCRMPVNLTNMPDNLVDLQALLNNPRDARAKHVTTKQLRLEYGGEQPSQVPAPPQ